MYVHVVVGVGGAWVGAWVRALSTHAYAYMTQINKCVYVYVLVCVCVRVIYTHACVDNACSQTQPPPTPKRTYTCVHFHLISIYQNSFNLYVIDQNLTHTHTYTHPYTNTHTHIYISLCVCM